MISLAGHRSSERRSLTSSASTYFMLHDPRLSPSQWQEFLEQKGNFPLSVQQDRSIAKKIMFSWVRNINPSIFGRTELLSAYPFTCRFTLALTCRQICTDLWSLWHVSWFRADPSVSNKSTSKRSQSVRTHLVALHRRHSMDLQMRQASNLQIQEGKWWRREVVKKGSGEEGKKAWSGSFPRLPPTPL